MNGSRDEGRVRGAGAAPTPGREAARRFLLGVAVLACANGCASVSYYRQAMAGQLEIFRLQRPNEKVMADAETCAETKGKLALIAELCAFAEKELALPAEGNYTRYAELGREHVVWSVFAAPEFSLEPHTWWYPVIGRLSYRGFFREEMAKEAARALAVDGFDVFVGGVDAYSTLGWFRDPVLSTFVHDPDAWLAELIFHELTHRRLYIAGETDFNEAMATAVAEEGVRRWLRAGGRVRELRAYGIELARRREVYDLIHATRGRLARLYGEGDCLAKEEMRRRKKGEMARLANALKARRSRWGAAIAEGHWFEEELNNAHLNAMATYHELVPMFERLLAESGGDLDKFFAEARRIGRERKRAAKSNGFTRRGRGPPSASGSPRRGQCARRGRGSK